MEAVLDFSKEFNVTLFDRIVGSVYAGNETDRHLAQQILTRFQDHPNAWQQVPKIMESSQNPQSKYLGLQILQKTIQTRWKFLPESDRNGIRSFVLDAMLTTAADESLFWKEKTLMNKLNLTLVQLLKQEWPHNWPNFIPELLRAAKTGLTICENSMVILRLLSEEIFDYSADQMTQEKAKKLKASLENQFSDIFQICSEVLEKAHRASLIKATLEALLRFMTWIPLRYIFETPLIDMLLTRVCLYAQRRLVLY